MTFAERQGTPTNAEMINQERSESRQQKQSQNPSRRRASQSLSPNRIRRVMSPMIGPVMKGLKKLSKPSEITKMRAGAKENVRSGQGKKEGKMVDSSVPLGEDGSGADADIGGDKPLAVASRQNSVTNNVGAANDNRNQDDRFASYGYLSLGAFELLGHKELQHRDNSHRPDVRRLCVSSDSDLAANVKGSDLTDVEKRRSRSAEKRSKQSSANPPKASSFSSTRTKPHNDLSQERPTSARSFSHKPPVGRSGAKKSASPNDTTYSDCSAPDERFTKAIGPPDSPVRKSENRSKEVDRRGVPLHPLRKADAAPLTTSLSPASPKRRRARSLDEDNKFNPEIPAPATPSPGADQRRTSGGSRGPTSSPGTPFKPERGSSVSREAESSRRRSDGDHRSGNHRSRGDSHHGVPSKGSSGRSSSRQRNEKASDKVGEPPPRNRSKSEKMDHRSPRRSRTESPAPAPEGDGRPQHRSCSREKSKQNTDGQAAAADEKPRSYRRGKRPTQKLSLNEEPIPAGSSPTEDVEPEKPLSGSSIVTKGSAEWQNSGRHLAIERNNLTKETLAHVRDIKEDFKQMRAHRKTSTEQPMWTKSDGNTQPQSSKLPLLAKLSPAGRSRRHASPATPGTPLHTSFDALMNASRLALNSSSMVDLRNSIGAISFEDLDVGFVKKIQPAPSVESEEDLRIQELEKQLKETKKLIKRTTRDVWTEREAVISYQRNNWSIRKSLMQSEGPPDSATSLNMKIERLLRQQRELDMEADQLRGQKDTVGEQCIEITRRLDETKELFDKLSLLVVPLLPPQDLAPATTAASAISVLQSRKSYPAVAHSEEDDDSIRSEEDISISLSDIR